MASVVPPFDTDYTLELVGQAPGLPTPYAGLIFQKRFTNRLLIGGSGNQPGAFLYQVNVTRDLSYHVTGVGNAIPVISAPYIDGGVAYHPDSEVLFVTGWPENLIHQYLPGSASPSLTTDLDTLSVDYSVGSLGFVPAGYPGAGKLMVITWPGGSTYFLDMIEDGNGTYTLSFAASGPTVGGGPEGYIYVPLGSTLFPNPSIMVTEYSGGRVVAYELQADGFPDISTERAVVTGLFNAEGAAVDPLTGDYLFTTFGGTNSVYVLSGGFVPIEPSPDPVGTLVYSLEFVKDSQPSDPGVFIQLQTELPEFLDKVYLEDYDNSSNLADGVFAIEGIVCVAAQSFRLYVEKSPIFDWEEVLNPLIEYLRRYYNVGNVMELGRIQLGDIDERRRT
jgi:hypothetical protein